MAAPALSSTAAATALSAFQRGVERRALVVAQLQCGDATVADRAVAVAMHAFAGQAAGLQMADWPARFWRLLCSTPQLLSPAAGGQWPTGTDHLSGMAPGDRLALLLRVGAGMDEADASAVLGVDAESYRQALAGACPLDAQGHPDAAAWRALAEAVQQQIRDLPVARQAQLAQAREALKTGNAAAAARSDTGAAPAPGLSPRTQRKATPPRYLWWLVPLLAVALLVGVWAWRSGSGTDVPAAPPEGALSTANPVQVESLPDGEGERVSAGPDPHAASDAAMLADPELALAREANFYAWFSAGGPVPVDESRAQPSRPEPAAAGLEMVETDE